MEFIEDRYLCGIEEELQVGGEIVAGSEYAEYLTTATDVTITGDDKEPHKGIASFYAMTNSFTKDGAARSSFITKVVGMMRQVSLPLQTAIIVSN